MRYREVLNGLWNKHKKHIMLSIISFLLFSAVVFIFKIMWNIFQAADAVILATLIAGLMGMFSFLVARYFEQQREFREIHRDRKIKIYQPFIDILDKRLREAGGSCIDECKDYSDRKTSDEMLEKTIMDMRPEMLLWSSPSVIISWIIFRKSGGDQGTLFRNMDQLLLSIRQDLGLNNKGLRNGELIRIYLNDEKELDRIFDGKARAGLWRKAGSAD